VLVPLFTRLDRFLPWPPLGLVAVAVPAAEARAGVPAAVSTTAQAV
jgi:hypothetical protein